MSPFVFDRIMSLHRRAYEVRARGDTWQDWWDLAKRLECPVDAIDQIWRTANLARDAGMTAKQAFPLTGEIEVCGGHVGSEGSSADDGQK